jgi:REP element-mobilizing transposase RayT
MNSDSLEPGEFYHIFSRTIGSELLFRSDENYSFFLKKYLEHCGEQFSTFAYCLLPNHFHFLVQVKENTTSEQALPSISNFLNSYSKSYNKLYERHGGLFQRKFKRKQIAKDSYLSQVIIYIHQNPQKHWVNDDFRIWKEIFFISRIEFIQDYSSGKRICTRLVWGLRSISGKPSAKE